MLLPICTVAARIVANSAELRLSAPVLVSPSPIVVLLVLCLTTTTLALPVPAAVPPTCEVALSAIASAVNVAVPVVSNKLPPLVVNVPLPAFTPSEPLPLLTVVLAATVTP